MNAAWRTSQTCDDAAIVAMSEALYREDPAPRPVPPEHTLATLAHFRGGPTRGRALVLEAGGKAEGYCLLSAYWSNELGGQICLIDELYVRPAHRDRGHARRLLRDLVAGSPLWEIPTVAFDLEVTPGNPRARAFYEALGFGAAKNAHLRFRR